MICPSFTVETSPAGNIPSTWPSFKWRIASLKPLRLFWASLWFSKGLTGNILGAIGATLCSKKLAMIL